ncbi:MAG: hypothetical protein QGI83_10245, partial [Candidatus Latescibacteria bacterium]|nr:hypothetical protein [Candidatus Latescibacterota bacterium]
MDILRRFGLIALIVFGAFAFFAMAVGPDSINPTLSALFGLRSPDPILPAPIPRAGSVIGRVLDAVSEADVRQLMDRFTRQGSRVPGYPGHDEAARFIQSEFERLGLQDIETEEYGVTSPIDKGGTLTVLSDGTTYNISAVWPNLVKTSTLPNRGVTARLVYGGNGDFGDFNGHEMTNTVALMEFNSWNNWLNAAMLGSGQIIFIEPDSTFYTEAEQKFLQVPNSVERFWIDKASGRALQARLAREGELEVELKARMDWEKSPTSNILGRVVGTDPELRDQIIVISAYYDAMSVVPALAPGAEMSCGIVAMMKMAEYFSRYPPPRTVLFLATSANHLGFRGVCDFLGRHSRKERHFAELMTDPIDVRLFIGLDLTSQTDEIGLWNSTRNFYYQRFFTPFGKSFVRYSKAIAESFGLDPANSLVDGINPTSGMTWDMYIPGKDLRTAGQVVLEAGTPALSLVTVNDARFRVDTPLDLPDHVNYANLTGQVRLLTGVLDLALNSPDLIPDYRLNPDDRMRGLKGFVRTFPRRSIVPDRPKPGAVAALRMGIDKSIKGVRRIYYDVADGNGEFYMPGIAERRVSVSAYYIDPESGDITYAPNFGQQAKIYRGEFDMDWWISKRTRILFPCISTDFYDTVDPRYLTKLSSISVYGDGHTAPQEYGYAIGFGPTEPVGTIFTRPGEKVKIAMRSGSIGVRFLLLNSISADNKEDARGEGFRTLTHGSFALTSFQAAKDMWTLNEARIRELKRFAIENQRLTTLHTDAAYNLERAEEAMSQKRWDLFMKHTRAALGIESRAYPDVKATQNDVIRGIIFFMILVIPCAFFAERLIFSSADIRWQITGFAGIFAVIWAFLSVVHPAFDLSNPFVILLAFVIFALAIFVISIVFTRFNQNMRRIRTSEVLLHETDVGRMSASLAAFHLGIANMKRRKLRTWLTFATLLLLTFTVLSFTSIKSTLQFHQLLRESQGAYPGVLIRSKFWGSLEQVAFDYAKTHFDGMADVAPRSWYYTRDKKKIPVESEGKSFNSLGILGMTPQEPRITEIDKCLKAGRWFRPGELACILPDKIAEHFGITAYDVGRRRVRLFGEQLTVIGLVDSEKLKQLRDLDDEILSPADFEVTDDEAIAQMMSQEKREKQGLEQPEVEIMPFEHIDPDDIVIIPYYLLREVGSPLQSVAIRFNEDVDILGQVKALLSRLSVVLFAGIPGPDGQIRISVYSSLGDTSMRGLGNLFIPILIAALIVLNTMMGSVYERFREIGIYSAVGLAPVHISFLFIAEACVYAVLGTVGGYLMGQGVAKVLLWQGWLEGVTLNYSALSAISSSVLVMIVVILSTIYPARQASLMAVPDVTRRWKLPDPEGDRWHFEFPFTVAGDDVFGLSVFLVDYFKAHSGEAMGTFYTGGAELGSMETDEGDGYTIDTTVWLAPYDLGVSEQV